MNKDAIDQLIEKASNLEIKNGLLDWRPVLSSLQIERISTESYTIHSFIDGWKCADVSFEELERIIRNPADLLHLDWY